jgi:hypothetical protein
MRIVVLISKLAVGDRGTYIKELSKMLSKMISHIGDYLGCFTYIFTKYESTEEE